MSLGCVTSLRKVRDDCYMLEQTYAKIPEFMRFIPITKEEAMSLLKQLQEEFHNEDRV